MRAQLESPSRAKAWQPAAGSLELFRAGNRDCTQAKRQVARVAATTSLARLFANQGRRDEARAILADVYNWFTEGFDTVDLIYAKTLLDQSAN